MDFSRILGLKAFSYEELEQLDRAVHKELQARSAIRAKCLPSPKRITELDTVSTLRMYREDFPTVGLRDALSAVRLALGKTL